MTRTEHAGGADRIDFEYDGNAQSGLRTIVTDYTGANGAAISRTYRYRDLGFARFIDSVSAPCSQCSNTAQSTTYTAAGDKCKEIAHDGSVVFYKHDAKGRETEWASFPASYHGSTTGPALSKATQVVSTQWHGTFHLPRKVAEPNRITTTTYNAKGMLTGESWTATTDATGAAKFGAVKTGSTYATGWGFNTSSLNTSIVEKTDAVETQRWTLAYNAAGDVTQITDVQSGAIARGTQYDAQGRIAIESDPFGTRTVEYAPTGLLRSETFASTSTVPGYTLTATHNSAGLVTELNTGTGLVYRWTYDASHKITSLTLNGSALTASAEGAENLLTRLLALLTLSRDARAQTAPPVSVPGGGLRGPGWLGVAGLIYQIGRNVMNQQQTAADSPEKEGCDPCHDSSKRPKWTSNRNKHTVPPQLA